MSDQSKIEWTDATWNPVTGCTKVSPGCDHCYAETLHERFNGKGSFATVTLHPERLEKPLGWRKPRRVFVNSMSDLFHDAVPDEFIARVWATMAASPQHTFQVLTKRHGRMRSLLSSEEFDLAVAEEWSKLGTTAGALDPDHTPPYPLPNVWIGVSTEDQKWADIRIPALLETPAAVRWISAEPLLGPIELHHGHTHCPTHDFAGGFCVGPCPDRFGLDWVVVGGESGPGARPMDPAWARSLRDQCVDADVRYLFKQWGAWKPIGEGIGAFSPPEMLIGSQLDRWGHRQVMRRVGKARAGRELDGRTWDEYPEVAA
ncbi:phage Gp37/Gp68 family protein [Amycolatopsis sp. NPDC051373]|uniref:DUF5131 family protein n=1 Tax=Amycolatopsis sp. NPDC051373 TaxID=3155801 RepID=UPI00344F3322